jgi:hypothetical protein
MFWSEGKEPLRQYRWYMSFDGSLKGMRYALKKASRPTMKISEVTHKYLNHFFYYPGRLEWDPISVTFASAVTTDNNTLGDNSLMTALISAGYLYPKSENQLSTISKIKAINQLTNGTAAGNNSGNKSQAGGGALNLIQIDADGSTVETWSLWNCIFTDVKFDSLDYSSEEIMNIDVTIKYDYATLDDATGNTLVGTQK